MKRITIIIVLLALVQIATKAEDFYFLASEDYLYENPANWYPSYPGTEVAADDQIVIMSDVYFAGYDLKVAGKLKVMLGAKLSSAEGNIFVLEGGTMDNEGEILVNQVENHGTFTNRISALFHVNDYFAHSGAVTNNSLKAQFTTIGNLINEGRFDNYSQCVAGRNFENRAVFNQIRNSQLEISGEILLDNEGQFNQSADSAIFLGANSKVPVQGIEKMFE